MDYANANILIF